MITPTPEVSAVRFLDEHTHKLLYGDLNFMDFRGDLNELPRNDHPVVVFDVNAPAGLNDAVAVSPMSWRDDLLPAVSAPEPLPFPHGPTFRNVHEVGRQVFLYPHVVALVPKHAFRNDGDDIYKISVGDPVFWNIVSGQHDLMFRSALSRSAAKDYAALIPVYERLFAPRNA